MKERIVLAPGVKGKELVKSLVVNGNSCINLRVCSAVELARILLMRSGIIVKEEFLDPESEALIIAEAVSDESYFKKISYADIKKIEAAVRRIRTFGKAEALKEGTFIEKNNALIRITERYISEVKKRNAIDRIFLIEKAISEADPIDAEFITLEEYPLSPLDKKLLDKASKDGYKTISLSELYKAEDKNIKIESIKNCYGAPNEVEDILDDIYRNRSLDKCTVAVTDPSTYGQLFFDYALLYNIPVSIGCGIPIINSNPAKLLTLYHKWMTSGFYGKEALNEMLGSDAFNKKALNESLDLECEDIDKRTLYSILGDLRFTNNKEINKERLNDLISVIDEDKKKYIPYLEVFAKELSLPMEEFINKYSYLRNGNKTVAEQMITSLDHGAIKKIYNELKTVRSSGADQNDEDIITSVLRAGISTGKCVGGSLYVTDINGAASSIRENMYFAGMSANKFPGSPKENYLLLDEDIELLSDPKDGEDEDPFTSRGSILLKMKRFLSLIKTCAGLGSKVYVSYAGLDVSELKRENASSAIYDLYRLEHGKSADASEMEKVIQKVDYFDPAISRTREIGKAYNRGDKVIRKERKACIPDKSLIIDIDEAEYSPTAIEEFYTCPRSFMLHRIMGINNPSEDDPLEVISAADIGTMAHSLMEELANSKITLDEFLKLSEETFDKYILEHPPVMKERITAEKQIFLDMMETAYLSDPRREVVLKEEDVHARHESGVRIFGFPDRVEKLDDGTCLIVDFKTGSTIRHVEEDFSTCFQAIVYAYLMESLGYKVSGCEFRYIRLGECIRCSYNDEMKENLNATLLDFKQKVESKEFIVKPTNEEGNDNCRFCGFKDVCGLHQIMRAGGA